VRSVLTKLVEKLEVDGKKRQEERRKIIGITHKMEQLAEEITSSTVAMESPKPFSPVEVKLSHSDSTTAVSQGIVSTISF
jgi:hypothetical protein